MPWINLTVRAGALTKDQQHEAMARMTEALMWWERVPDTPVARSVMKGWVYEVAADADYVAGSPVHEAPYFFVEVRIPAHRLDALAKLGIARDFATVITEVRGEAQTQENHDRVWVTIQELETDDWAIGGHTDWLRRYTSALTEDGRKGRP